MKRILMYTHELTYTGAPNSLLRMCRVLKDEYFITVWSKQDGAFYFEFENNGIEIEVVPENELPDRVDDIKTYDLAIGNTIASWRFYNICKKYINTVWYIREASNLPGIISQNLFWKSVLMTAENVYSVSEYAADFIKKEYGLDTTVVHNCVEDFYEGKIKEEKPYVSALMLGTISYRKGFDVAVSAYGRLTEDEQNKFKLVFAGKMISEREYGKDLLAKAGKYKNIEYLGEVTDKGRIIELYEQADIVLVPSRDESCSLVVLEGAMMAKALIASSNVGAKYLIDDENGYLFENENDSQLYEIFVNVLERKDCIRQMGERSREKYLRYANIEIYKKNIKDLVKTEIERVTTSSDRDKYTALSDKMYFNWLEHVNGIVKKRDSQLLRKEEIITAQQHKIENLRKYKDNVQKQNSHENEIDFFISHNELMKRGIRIGSEKKYGLSKKNLNVWKGTAISLLISPENARSTIACIYSLLFQSVSVEKIFLMIPLEKFPNRELDLPVCISDLIKKHFVEACWVHDRGRSSAYAFLQKWPLFRWIVLDGQTEYPSDYVKKIQEEVEKHPECINCSDSERIFTNKKTNRYEVVEGVCKKDSPTFLNIMKPGCIVYPDRFFSDFEIPENEYLYWNYPELFVFRHAVGNNTRINCFDLDYDNLMPEFEYEDDVFSEVNYKGLFDDIDDLIKKEEAAYYNEKLLRILIPAMQDNIAYNGDYYFACSLAKAFEKKGFSVELCLLDEWYRPFDGKYILAIRGPREYKCQPVHVNIMWNISHPEDISLHEYSQYDYVFVASKKWKKKIEKALEITDRNVCVEELLQCSDEDVFYKDHSNRDKKRNILFVGMNHAEGRKVINDLFPTELDISIYGPRWKGTRYEKYLMGNHIANSDLSDYYSSSAVSLNDTRPFMLENGFVPNRIYDVFLSGGLALTQYSEDAKEIFGTDEFMYDGTHEGLISLINFYSENHEEREKLISEMQKIILDRHLFSHRVEMIVKTLSEYGTDG